MRNILAKTGDRCSDHDHRNDGADNSIGAWKRNVAKSTSTTPSTNPITSLTIVNEAVDRGVKTTVTGQRKDGTAINSTSTVKYDGKEYPVTGAPWDTISIKQIDANTFTSEAKKTGGKFDSKGRMVISKDRQDHDDDYQKERTQKASRVAQKQFTTSSSNLWCGVFHTTVRPHADGFPVACADSHF
jgi:hypothetical protein